MHKFDNNIHLSKGRSSLASVFYLIGIFFLGFQGIGGLLGIQMAKIFYGGDFLADFSNPSQYPAIKYPAFILQSTAAILGLIVIPYIYLKVREKQGFSMFFKQKIILPPLILLPILVISSMGVLSVIIDWNANISFPEFLSGIESIARKTENRLAELTRVLTTFDSTTHFIVAMVVIAIIPSIGEEIVFRGIMQNELRTVTKNPHVAIWLSALIFSAIHMQFFGFVPRMLLGALFGYVYYWSGNLIFPIIAHFINNGFSLTLAYLATGDSLFGNLENSQSPPLSTVLLFVIITAVLLYHFRKYFLKKGLYNDQVADGI